MTSKRWMLGALLVALSAWVPSPAAAAPDGDSVERTAQVARVTTPGLEPAEALLKALTDRSIELQGREKPTVEATAPKPAATRSAAGATPPAAAPVPSGRPRLSARLSGPQSHRQGPPPQPPSDLAGYVFLLSRTTPGGQVTGRFNDWRSPSIYRVFGGLHNGYDVALRAGSAVVVGWPGRVTAITPWAGREYGITVLSPEGFQTTYGHLAPGVRVGTWMEPGDVVGFVVWDHVDIKMKDGRGRFVDFARGVPMIARASESAPVPEAPVAPPPPPLQGPDWTKKPEAMRAAVSYVRFRVQEASMLLNSGQTPPVALALVRRQLAEARSRLLLHGVPEQVLLSAFVESPALQSANFFMGDAGGDPVAGVDLLGDWLKRQQMMRDARAASPELKMLMKDLSAAK